MLAPLPPQTACSFAVRGREVVWAFVRPAWADRSSGCCMEITCMDMHECLNGRWGQGGASRTGCPPFDRFARPVRAPPAAVAAIPHEQSGLQLMLHTYTPARTEQPECFRAQAAGAARSLQVYSLHLHGVLHRHIHGGRDQEYLSPPSPPQVINQGSF